MWYLDDLQLRLGIGGDDHFIRCLRVLSYFFFGGGGRGMEIVRGIYLN